MQFIQLLKETSAVLIRHVQGLSSLLLLWHEGALGKGLQVKGRGTTSYYWVKRNLGEKIERLSDHEYHHSVYQLPNDAQQPTRSYFDPTSVRLVQDHVYLRSTHT
jgi:hypothetical protein